MKDTFWLRKTVAKILLQFFSPSSVMLTSTSNPHYFPLSNYDGKMSDKDTFAFDVWHSYSLASLFLKKELKLITYTLKQIFVTSLIDYSCFSFLKIKSTIKNAFVRQKETLWLQELSSVSISVTLVLWKS